MKIPSSEVKKIGIFRALQLGDTLCAIPAIRALKAAYPNAHITLISLPWAKSFVERFNQYFDAFIHFPGYPGLPEQPFDAKKTVQFLVDVQEQQFDLLLQMQGNGTLVNPLMELFNAKYTAGFYLDYRPNEEYFLKYPNYGHEVERHLQLMQYLGIPAQGKELEYPLFEKDYAEFENINLPLEKGRYVCIHPGSRGVSRQWPPKYFAALADYVCEQGLKAVITGTKDEAPIIDELIGHMKHEAINTAGLTTMGSVAVLIKNAFALISNCTGVSHIASALQVPSVVISLDGEAERWAPLNKQLHKDVDWTRQPEFKVVFDALASLITENLPV